MVEADMAGSIVGSSDCLPVVADGSTVGWGEGGLARGVMGGFS